MSTSRLTPDDGNMEPHGSRASLPRSHESGTQDPSVDVVHGDAQDQFLSRTPTNDSPSNSPWVFPGRTPENRRGRSRFRRHGRGHSFYTSTVGWTSRASLTAEPAQASDRSPTAHASGHSSPGNSGTPAWLLGAYRSPVAAADAVEREDPVSAWCTDRLNAMRASANGGANGLPEMDKIVETLEYDKILPEIDLARRAAQERLQAQRRVLQAEKELAVAERKIEKLNRRSARVTMKIARMRGHAEFIEKGWVDEESLSEEKENSEATNM